MKSFLSTELRCSRMLAMAVVALILLAGSAAQDSAAQQPPAGGATSGSGGSRFRQPDPLDFNDHQGWTQLFDGKTLKNWDGNPQVWHVEDGAIVGVSSPESPSGTTNLIYRGGEFGNFALKLEVKLEGEGANGGIQFRSANVPPAPRQTSPDQLAQMSDEQKQRMQQADQLREKNAKWNMKGYQADIDARNRYSGQIYEQDSPRGIIAWRSQVVETARGRNPRLIASLGNSDDLAAFVKSERMDPARNRRHRKSAHRHSQWTCDVHPDRQRSCLCTSQGPHRAGNRGWGEPKNPAPQHLAEEVLADPVGSPQVGAGWHRRRSPVG